MTQRFAPKMPLLVLFLGAPLDSFLPAFTFPGQNRFGEALGERVWESCNAVFDRLPLAGVIDQDIFCVHGGIPRPLEGSTSRIQVCPPEERIYIAIKIEVNKVRQEHLLFINL